METLCDGLVHGLSSAVPNAEWYRAGIARSRRGGELVGRRSALKRGLLLPECDRYTSRTEADNTDDGSHWYDRSGMSDRWTGRLSGGSHRSLQELSQNGDASSFRLIWPCGKAYRGKQFRAEHPL